MPLRTQRRDGLFKPKNKYIESGDLVAYSESGWLNDHLSAPSGGSQKNDQANLGNSSGVRVPAPLVHYGGLGLPRTTHAFPRMTRLATP